MDELRPADLYRAIAVLTARLERFSLNKARAPLKPFVNRAFNSRPQAEVLVEATIQRSRRI
jgi:hypothetical protein